MDEATESDCWWQQVLSAVREEFPTRLDAPNPSLAPARVTYEVCTRLGITAEPTPVFVGVYNTPAWRALTRGTEPGAWMSGERTVGIDERARLTDHRGWAGHLVVIVTRPTTGRLLLDPSADRFDRPIRNLLVGSPLVVPLPADTPAAPAAAHITPTDQPDIVVSYRPMPLTHPGRNGWATTPTWTDDDDTETTRAADRLATRLQPHVRAFA